MKNLFFICTAISLFQLPISIPAYGQYDVATEPVDVWTKNICKGSSLIFTYVRDSTFDSDAFGNGIKVPNTKYRWWFPGVNTDTLIGRITTPVLFDKVGDFEFVVEKSFRNPPVKYSTWYPGAVIHVVDAMPNTEPSVQNISVNLAESTTLKACGAGVQYQWLPNKDLNTDSALEVNVIQPFSNTIYTCTITDTNGCQSSCEYHVKVNDEPKTIYIANAFTPNADGFNDVFKPITLNSEIRYMYIFNRFGELFFSMKNTGNTDFIWDGKNKNGVVEAGVYVVKIGWLKGHSQNEEVFIGNVNVIK
jgi:gliding motility-associated-like protein